MGRHARMRCWTMMPMMAAAAMMLLALLTAAAPASSSATQDDAAAPVAAVAAAATPTAVDGAFVPSIAAGSAASAESSAPSARLASSLRAYLRHAPLTRPAAAATFDADDSMAEPSADAQSAAVAAVAAGAASPAAHQLHTKLHALRRRGQLLRKYGRLSTPGWAGDAPDVASLRTFGMHESTSLDASSAESDPALLESWSQAQAASASASASTSTTTADEEEVDQAEWEIALQQAQLQGRPKVTQELKRAVQFSVQSAGSGSGSGGSGGSGGGGHSGGGVLAPAPWELQPSLTEQEGNVMVDDTPATDIREDTARVASRLHKPDIGTSSPQKDEVRRRSKTADLQLPSSQISQIILWTKQHILWMVASLGDHLPAEAVAAFPKPTRNELYGYVYSLMIDPQNPNSWVDSLSNDFDDMLLLQVWQYKSFQNFFDWIQISTVLFSLREETNFPLSPIQKRRLWTRYTGLFREDINIINLGEEGELRRYVTWKWQLEYVGEVLSEVNTEHFVAVLLDLHAKMRAMDIRPGLIKYYTAMFIEKLAKFRLDYTYDAAQEYWANAYRAIEGAMQAAGVEVTGGGASYRGQKRMDPVLVTFDPAVSGLNRTALQQIEDAGIPSNQPFDPYTLPINVLSLIETDLSKLQGTAIASISNYLQWHAKFHGNWQEDLEVAADQMSDQAYLNDPEAAAQRRIIEAQPTQSVSNAAAAARVRKQVAESGAKTVSATNAPAFSFRDISSADSDFGALMPGFVESDSNAQEEVYAAGGGMGSSRVGALLEAQAAATRARLARQEEEARLREEVAARPDFAEFRAQTLAPDTRGREKQFIKQIGLDARGIPHVQPLSADMPEPSAQQQKRGRFQTMSAGGGGSASAPGPDPACVPFTTEALRAESAQLRVALQAQVDACAKCWPQMRATHSSSIDSLIATVLPVTEAAVSEIDACSSVEIRERLHSTVATALYTQLHFLQPYYTHLYGSALGFTQRTAADDLEFLYLFAVQVAQNHLHKEDGAGNAVMSPEQFANLQHNHVRDWCALLLQLAVSHPRTRAPATELNALTPQFQWRSLLKHVHEILNWGWYQSPRTTVRLHAQQQQRDLRYRHSTHVGLAVDGIVQTEVGAPVVAQFALASSQPNHTASYASGALYAAATRGARSLMSSDADAPFDDYTDSYSDGFDQPLEEMALSSDQSLLESRLSAPLMSARTQLRLLLHRANVSESLFDINGFLRASSPSSFQVLSERLIIRLRQIFMAFQIDNVKSWHSDRSKSPSASYDFDPSIHEIDFLVWLDSMNYNPAGHLGLDTIAVYAESNVEMINKKVSADDKYTRETHLRNQVPPAIWLRSVSAFEKWRWSWTYPQSRKLFTPNEEIVFDWLEGWGGTSNMKLGALVAWVSSTIWALLQIVRYQITKPWQRSSLVRNGSIHYEQKYHEEYERRERSIVLWRVLPINILTTYIGNFMMCTFILALNFSYYNPLALFFYLAIFRWLTSVIFDVYALKFFMYLVLFIFPKQRTGDLKPPLCACSIPLSASCMILNPIRPANDDQLRQAVRKQIDLLWAASSQHIISILILQAEGNLTSTFRRYEQIIREIVYDCPDVPQHVKDRFFVFHVAEVTKPHNMFKVMHWLFMRSEQYDPVTRSFLFGMDTSAKIERTRKIVRRAPFGLQAPAFATLGNARAELAEAQEMDATDIELLDDKDLADPEHEAEIEAAVAKARAEKAQKLRQRKLAALDSASSSSASVSSASSSDAAAAAAALTPEESAALLQRQGLGATMNRWAFAITGAPESAYEEHDVADDPRAALIDTEAARRERVSDKAEKQLAMREARAERRRARLAAQKASKAASTDAAGARKKVDPLLPSDADFPDELSRVVIEDATSDSDDDADLSEDDLADPEDDTEAALTALKIPRSIFHCTYEPLVYLGGQLNYKGYEQMGADSGIMCTVQGLHNLLYLRNEGKPGEPLIENFAVLDADNYVEPVTLLRMLATMTDDYMIWQPCIKFYNRDQSMYAYMKDFTNEHLGHFMNIANVWMFGGIRSFGKYFGRLKRFYYEECTADSCSTAPEQYSFLFNICSGLMTLCMMLYCIRPLGEQWLYVALIVTPILTIGTCAFIWWTHRKLRNKAFDVSSSTDPDIGKGEHLLGFGPIQGDAVVDDYTGARDDVGAPRKSRIGTKNRERRAAAIMGDSRKVTARFQNMFPLNRLFIQSEDSRHGGPFGRAVYLQDDCIHESTPISPLDDNQREYSKWLPTFDMRDFLLLHTPMLWILQHLTLSVWLAGGAALSFAFIFAISFLRVDLPSSLVQVWCFMLCMASCALCWAFWSLRSAMTEPVLLALRASRFPEMPERAQYTEDLMIRGIWSETIWLLQFVLGIFCLLVPGTVEIAYPFLGEFHLLVLLILLIHPKFTAPLLTRLHYVFHPKWKGYWRARDAVLAANEKAKKKGLKTLMKKGKHHLVANLGGAAAIKAAANVAEDEVVGVDDDGNQILQPKSSKAITADALYELSKANNLTHTCLFETGSFNVCGRNLPKWNHDASLKQGEKYSKLKDKSGYTMDTRFMFRLPSLEECGARLEISWEAVERKHRKIMLWIENTKDREAAAEAEALRVQIEGDAAKKAAALAASSGHMVAFPLGRVDEDHSASSSTSGVATITTIVPADEISATLAALRATEDYADVPEADVPATLPSASLTNSKTVVVSKRRPPKDASKVAFPLSKDEEAEAEILEAQRALHRRYLQQRAATWMERQYIIWREKRWQPILQLSFLWLLHDLPVGIFEFTASTTVFGLKLLTKPPQVVWAMIGCCVEIKGLLLGVATPGTWPSFVESTQTLPLSRYIQEYHVPMGVSLVLFFLCIPSMPGILATSEVFTNPLYLAMLGLGFGALLGLWPAWNSFDKLRTVIRNRAAGGWSQLRQLRWFRESWSLAISLLMFVLIFFFAMAAWMLRGSFPAVFFIRSFPILIASFVLGPGIAWLLGMSHGVIDHTTNPPRYRKAYMSMILCVGVGMFILVCAGLFILALAQVLLPLQRAFGASDAGGGGMHHSGGNIPTGDGTAAVILPFSLTYGEMIKAPWYFLIPYAGIVYGSMLLAVLAWPSALFHQCWTWWFYSCTKRGRKEDRGLRAYNVDDLQHQSLREKREKIASLEKAGASKDLVRALAAEAVAAAAAAQGRFKSSPTFAATTADGTVKLVDAPVAAEAAPALGAGGMRAQAGKGRRGAVSLHK